MRAVCAVWLLVGCTAGAPARADEAPRSPPRPAECRLVAPGGDLQAVVESAPAGAAICLAPGRYPGPLVLAQPITLWGPADAVVHTSGQGTTIRVTGTGVRLAGFTLDGCGTRLDQLDAAVHVTGEDHQLDGLHVDNASYGILVERARRVSVRGNQVAGDDEASFGLRGDPIRLWETNDSLVEDNRVRDGRDVVVWYSSHNQIRRNRVTGGRYGTHLMYSHDNLVEDNRYEHGVVGVFAMYSRKVVLRGNLVLGAAGAAGIGVGLKDSGDIQIEGNRLIGDTVGLFVDNSPAQRGETVIVEQNQIRLCEAGVVFHGSGERVRLASNHFADNQTQVRSESGGDARAASWEGNFFDDYAGYDLDGDGFGDVAYELRSTTGALVERHPESAFLSGTPALGLAEAAGRLIPLVVPTLMLVDPRPRMAPVAEVRDAPRAVSRR
jgi:nitrous oxidase accessory protein